MIIDSNLIIFLIDHGASIGKRKRLKKKEIFYIRFVKCKLE